MGSCYWSVVTQGNTARDAPKEGKACWLSPLHTRYSNTASCGDLLLVRPHPPLQLVPHGWPLLLIQDQPGGVPNRSGEVQEGEAAACPGSQRIPGKTSRHGQGENSGHGG